MLSLARQHAPSRLDLLCACLTAGTGRPGIERTGLDPALARCLASPTLDHGRLAHLAGRHLVTPMLAGCLDDPGLRQDLPKDFVRYLDFIGKQNRLRNDGLRQQLTEMAGSLNQAGIEPVLLKGAIRLVDGLYPHAGWRFMRDLDILVAEERLPDAVACLEASGHRFTQPEADWPAHHRHLPPQYRDGDGAVVELHTVVLSGYRELCLENDVIARSKPVDLGAATVRIPDEADQLAHLIGHDLTDGYLRRSSLLQLRSVLETALLCQNGSTAAAVLARCSNNEAAAAVRVVLGLAASFFPALTGPVAVDRLGERLRIRRLAAMERLDENGRARRFLWFTRMRGSKLLTIPSERRHLAAHLLSADYYLRCLRRLRRLWASD